MGQDPFIPLVRDSIIIIESRSVYTFGSRFTYKRWVRVLSKIWILAFLGKYSNIVCWVSKRVDWGSHHSNIVCWVSMRVDCGSRHQRFGLATQCKIQHTFFPLVKDQVLSLYSWRLKGHLYSWQYACTLFLIIDWVTLWPWLPPLFPFLQRF